MYRPLFPSPTPAHRVAACALVGGVAICFAAAVGGCARPEELELSPEALDRDRAAREAVAAEIERDHETLASLIASDRFEEPEAIYSDPELRKVALHLVEQTRKLQRLSGSDVLSPGAP